MTDAQKVVILKTLLDDGGEVPSDDKLSTYLLLAGNEILNWMYINVGGIPAGVTDVPGRYEGIQIYAVVTGYTQAGAEGESAHIENGVHRDFNYSNMIDYIHKNVVAIANVGAAK